MSFFYIYVKRDNLNPDASHPRQVSLGGERAAICFCKTENIARATATR